MANIKYVKKRSGDEQQPQAAPVVRDFAMRPSRTSQRAAASEPEPEPTHVPQKPAAFPSLPANTPPPPFDPKFSGHGMRELMAAIETGDKTRMEHIKDHFKIEYEAGKDPWYVALRRRWDPKMVDSKTIIEQIKDDFIPGTYISRFYPVCCILSLSKAKLDTIMAENAAVWETEAEIPQYFKDYRRRYPHAIIDPEEPPPVEVVKAIRFLRQQRLPVSLLGEWQALPGPECPARRQEVLQHQTEVDTLRAQGNAEYAALDQRE
ncbi:uncharacterized protein J4E84_002316 [Alternaria hordeiaustralica]|uniref:uncharacterized protein n=1 Tax=Alternaria hordeiaustralica TaxID=1187925 RepID=UPI0020C57197|nr:uncharacterized protein J4E84_002316 [Alternaria hordeiaustralica]KAI4693741.1 hypothetical protein J4E84_002316 [Alternaria hordeiaustralica]